MTAAELNDRIIRIVAAALGAAIVLAIVLLARPAGGHGGVLPASLRLTLSQDGAIAVSPAAPKPLAENARLRPGGHVAGAAVVRNQTGERLAVRLRAQPSSTALDGLALVRISAGAKTIFDSTLQALRQGTSGAIAIAPGAAARVRVLARIPADAATGYEGRHVDVELTPYEATAR